MTNEAERKQDAMLAQILAEARRERPVARPEFLERIVADAVAEQARFSAASRRSPTQPAFTFAGLRARLGAVLAQRWEALAWPAGLAVATLAGFWLGGWADLNGFVGGSGFGTSELAMSLVHTLPDAAGLIGGF